MCHTYISYAINKLQTHFPPFTCCSFMLVSGNKDSSSEESDFEFRSSLRSSTFVMFCDPLDKSAVDAAVAPASSFVVLGLDFLECSECKESTNHFSDCNCNSVSVTPSVLSHIEVL